LRREQRRLTDVPWHCFREPASEKSVYDAIPVV
jgi:hypothetical protein